jgi:hypothetical protein
MGVVVTFENEQRGLRNRRDDNQIKINHGDTENIELHGDDNAAIY